MSSTKTIAYCCPFVPPEWIAAHGLFPLRIMPSIPTAPQNQLNSAGVCSYVKAFVAEIEQPHSPFDAVVVTTACDQMRRVAEYVQQIQPAPVFLLNVPATWQTAVSVTLYQQELQRLGRFLCRLGGQRPTNEQLAEQIKSYDKQRRILRDQQGCMDGEAFAKTLREFLTTNQLPSPMPDHSASTPSHTPSNGSSHSPARLALVGGPLRRDDDSIFQWIRQAGGQVVLDATESGELTLPGFASRREQHTDPLGELVDMYFGQIPHPMRRPNNLLYQYLQTELAARNVQGVIWQQTMWCDTWVAEAQRFRQWCSLPVLQWDTSDERSDHARIATRLEAFVEMLQP